MKILPLAADSLGVRSMATLVTGGHASVLIDPGVSLAGTEPGGLAPANVERQAAAVARARIIAAANRCQGVFVTSYGQDHHNLLADCRETLSVFLKTPKNSEEYAAAMTIIGAIKAPGRSIAFADGCAAAFDGLTASCSLGLGAMVVTLRGDERTFVHASSALNRDCDAAQRHIVEQAPDLIYLSGAPLYRLEEEDGSDHDGQVRRACRRALRALLEIGRKTGCRTVVDHELVRTMDYRQLYAPAFSTGTVCTAAEFLNAKEALLEAARGWRQRLEPIHTGGKITAAA